MSKLKLRKARMHYPLIKWHISYDMPRTWLMFTKTIDENGNDDIWFGVLPRRPHGLYGTFGTGPR